jgi:hypothetical protein
LRDAIHVSVLSVLTESKSRISAFFPPLFEEFHVKCVIQLHVSNLERHVSDLSTELIFNMDEVG